MKITPTSDRIKIEGHVGTWYVIDSRIAELNHTPAKPIFLLEHETYGDEAACLIVDENGGVILDDVYNGFFDLYENYDEDACFTYLMDGAIAAEDGNEPEFCENIPDVINLKEIRTPYDILVAFSHLVEKSKNIGYPISLNTGTSVPLKLKYNQTHRILVDIAKSSELINCPRCGSKLEPSDVAGYICVCTKCDENFL